ncbi:MAG: ArsR/SmtB family transcription factor [Candidatus Hodarchaeales archaeon]
MSKSSMEFQSKKQLTEKLEELKRLELSNFQSVPEHLSKVEKIKGRLMEIDNKEEFKQFKRLMKALDHPIRIKMLLAVIEGVSCPCELEYITGLAQATISHHLALLDEAGLIVRDRKGKWTTIKPGNYHFLQDFIKSF